MSAFPNVHLVIRAAGERTADVAKRLAMETLPQRSITVIEEVPFEEALRATYRAGIAAGCKWTMTLDADVLLRPGATSDLLAEAERMPPHYAQIEGLVFDKISGRYRPAGHRIFRTALLALALKRIPAAGTQMRPEYHTLCRLAEDGYPSDRCSIVVGLHDFEQHYRDLYRKALLHAAKHRVWIAEMITRCAERSESDPDYLVILKGLWDGLLLREPAVVDVRRYVERANRAIEALGLSEKGPLEVFPDGRETISQALERLTEGRQQPPFQRRPGQNPDRRTEWLDKVRGRIDRLGPVRGGIATFGAALRLLGARLDG